MHTYLLNILSRFGYCNVRSSGFRNRLVRGRFETVLLSLTCFKEVFHHENREWIFTFPPKVAVCYRVYDFFKPNKARFNTAFSFNRSRFVITKLLWRIKTSSTFNAPAKIWIWRKFKSTILICWARNGNFFWDFHPLRAQYVSQTNWNKKSKFWINALSFWKTSTISTIEEENLNAPPLLQVHTNAHNFYLAFDSTLYSHQLHSIQLYGALVSSQLTFDAGNHQLCLF